MRTAAQVVGVVLLVSGALALLGTVVAPALFWATGCEGSFKSFWGCDVGGLDVAPVIGIMVLSGVIALPWLLSAVAAMAVIGVVAAATWLRNQCQNSWADDGALRLLGLGLGRRIHGLGGRRPERSSGRARR